MANPTEPDIVVTFQAFFEHWLVHQQSLLDQLLSISSDTSSSTAKEEEEQQHRHLIQQVISHYNNYLIEKSKVARFDVFILFSPPWLSSTERTLLWIADFKPSLLFELINGSVQDLSEEQVQRIEELKLETTREERELMETMARIQESVATPPLVNVARQIGRLVNGEVEEVVSSAVDSAMVELKVAMLVVLGSADALRGMTVRKIVEILRPVQITKFLAAAAQFQLQIRRWGLQRDSERANTGFAFA